MRSFSQIYSIFWRRITSRALSRLFVRKIKIAFSRICDVHDIHIVVTDEKPSQEWLELFDRSGIACLYPEEQQ